MNSFSSTRFVLAALMFVACASLAVAQRPVTRDVAPICLVELPTDPSEEQIAAATAAFEAEAQSYFNRFIPCVFRPPRNPSYQCCSNLDNLFGPFPGVDFHNCFCLPGYFQGFVEAAGDRLDMQTLFNSCAAKFPLGFRTLFNSEATRASAAVTRCNADSVNIPADFVNPYADLSIEDFGLTEEDVEIVQDFIADEIAALVPVPEASDDGRH